MPSLQQVKAIIEKIPYITIASLSQEGEVWNAPVFTAYDKDFNFYWGSYQDSQHSKNIRFNKNIFLVIYDSSVVPGSGAGVYMRAKGIELSDSNEIEFVHKLLWDRHVVPYWKIEQVQPGKPIKLYKAVPEKVWTSGEGQADGHYIDTRVEIDLKKL